MKKLSKIYVKRVLYILGVPLVLFAIVILFLSINHELSQNENMRLKKFNKELWKNSTYKIEMYKDLEDNYLKVGMSFGEILNLLGPTNVRRVYNINGKKQLCYQYIMGAIHSYQFSTGYFLIICPNNDLEKLNSYKLLKEYENDNGTVIYNYTRFN